MLAQLETRLSLPASRRHSARQRTLRATLDWSYRLLTSEQRRLFVQLSLFRGGFTAEAAAEICDEPSAEEYLAQLQERSLLVAEERGETLRFHLLETLREYAAEHLAPAEAAQAEGRYIAYFVKQAALLQGRLWGPEMQRFLAQFDAENDNFRAALERAQARKEWQAFSELVLHLSPFRVVRGQLQEGREWIERMLAREMQPTEQRAETLTQAATLAGQQGDLNTARDYHAESLAIWRGLGNELRVVHALTCLAGICHYQGDYTRAQMLFLEAHALLLKQDDPNRAAHVLNGLARTTRQLGRIEEARDLHRESLARFRNLGDKQCIAMVLYDLGICLHALEEMAAEAECYRECLALRRELGDPRG